MPTILPTDEGGISFEWHTDGWDIELEILPSGGAEYWGEQLTSALTIDGPFTDDAVEFQRAVAGLAAR